MSAHDDSSFSARLWVQAEPYINRWPVRACGRAVAGSFPVGALVGALSDVPDELPGSSDRIMDLAFAGAAALFLVLWLRWIGRNRGGIVFAIRLSVISYVFWSSLLTTAYTAWLAVGMDGTQPDAGFIAFSAVVAAAMFVPSCIMLRRLDPD